MVVFEKVAVLEFIPVNVYLSMPLNVYAKFSMQLLLITVYIYLYL